MEAQAQLDQVLAQVQNTPVAYTTPVETHPTFNIAPKHRRNGMLRVIMYALQIVDAEESARLFRRGGYETHAGMKPFSHGGFATMALGFAIQDILRDLALRRSGAQTQNAFDYLQVGNNVVGIMQTEATLRRLK